MRMPAHAAVLAITGAWLALAAGNLVAQPIDASVVADPDEWPSWGRTGDEAHYSPLNQIDVGHVAGLKLAWHYDLEPGYSPTQPLEVGGKVFITTNHAHVRALDAVTGRELWEYRSDSALRAKNRVQLSWGNKGIAYWDGKIYVGETDGVLIALDANTGKPVWQVRDFGTDEQRNMSGQPRVYGGKVLIGHGGADVSPIRGYVTAYDARTGKFAWRFYTVPDDPSKPATTKAEQVMRPTWKGDWYGKGGGGTVWNAISYDSNLKLIYLGVGNGYPYNTKLRSPGGGDNLFLASIVAVDADTGQYVWHYQTCPAEQWDCTATADMTLATLKIDGQDRKVLMQAPKNGFFYVIDRKTGKLISAKNYAKVTWATGIDLKSGRPIESPGIRYQGKPGLFELWPGPEGAHSWMPQAYNPETGLVYIPVSEQGALIGDGDNGTVVKGVGVTLMPEAELPGGRHAYLRAWNPVTQTLVWEKKLPGSWPAGVMTTAGGLVFQGRLDGHFVAYEAKTGKELWSYQTDAPIVGPPASYRINGKQYVTVITGSGGDGASVRTLGNEAWRTDYRLPRRVLTFAIDGADPLQASPPPPLVPPADPDFKPNPTLAAAGGMVFMMNGCLACHGWNAVGGGQAPDLRYSPAIVDAATVHAIVKEGVLRANGMPQFADISDADLEAVRFYLRTRSKDAPAERAAAIKKADGTTW